MSVGISSAKSQNFTTFFQLSQAFNSPSKFMPRCWGFPRLPHLNWHSSREGGAVLLGRALSTMGHGKMNGMKINGMVTIPDSSDISVFLLWILGYLNSDARVQDCLHLLDFRNGHTEFHKPFMAVWSCQLMVCTINSWPFRDSIQKLSRWAKITTIKIPQSELGAAPFWPDQPPAERTQIVHQHCGFSMVFPLSNHFGLGFTIPSISRLRLGIKMVLSLICLYVLSMFIPRARPVWDQYWVSQTHLQTKDSAASASVPDTNFCRGPPKQFWALPSWSNMKKTFEKNSVYVCACCLKV